MNDQNNAQRGNSNEKKTGNPLRLETISSVSLLQGRDAVSIEHKGELYRLRQTRQGKLILTK
jgi:hemin uptake protein HemP